MEDYGRLTPVIHTPGHDSWITHLAITASLTKQITTQPCSWCTNIVFVRFEFKYNIAFMWLFIIIMVELNLGPQRSRQRQWRIMHGNVRGLHRSIKDLTL